LTSEEEAESEDEGEPISLAEITDVVKKLFNGKVPGVDEIRPEMLKALDIVFLPNDGFLLYQETIEHGVRSGGICPMSDTYRCNSVGSDGPSFLQASMVGLPWSAYATAG